MHFNCDSSFKWVPGIKLYNLLVTSKSEVYVGLLKNDIKTIDLNGNNSNIKRFKQSKYNPVKRLLKPTENNLNIALGLRNLSMSDKSLNKIPRTVEISNLLKKMINISRVGNPDNVIKYLPQLDKYYNSNFNAFSKKSTSYHLKDWNRIIKELGNRGYLNHCDKIVEYMIKSKISPSLITYTTLIAKAATWQNINKAELYFNRMLADNIKPDIQVYNSLINAYAKLKDNYNAFKLFDKIETLDIKPNLITFNTLIDLCARNANSTMAVEILQMMQTKYQIIPDEFSYTSVVHSYCQEGEITKAVEFVGSMINSGIKPANITYSVLLYGLGKYGNIDAAFNIIKKVKPNVIMMSSLIHACGLNDELDLALLLYNEMLNSTNAITKPNSITCSSLIDMFLKAGRVDTAFKIIQDMKLFGIKLNEVTYTSIITELTRLKQLDQIVEILSLRDDESSLTDDEIILDIDCIEKDTIARENSLNISPIFPQSAITTINRGVDSNKPDRFNIALDEYEWKKSAGIRPNVTDYHNLIESIYNYTLNINLSKNVAYQTKHMKYDELFRLYLVFQEMRASGIKPDTGVFNTLINACAIAGDIEKALETVQVMQCEGISPDVITYTSLIKACVINNGGSRVISIAEDLFETMQQRTNHFSSYVEPNELTYLHLMTAHLQNKEKIDTRRIWELYDDIKRNLGLKLLGIQIYRCCIRAAYHDQNVNKAIDTLNAIRSNNACKYDNYCWSLAANICSLKNMKAEERIVRDEMFFMENKK